MGKLKTLKVGKQSTRANFVPDSFNETTRSVDVTFATDKPVLRYTWDGTFYEVLDMAGMRENRTSGSLPVLNNHNAYQGVTGVIGRAENIRKEGGAWKAAVRFSNRTDVDGIVKDVQDGILQDISVGYRVLKYERQPLSEGETIPTYVARDWEPYEISFVVVPADEASKVRSGDAHLTEVEIIDDTTKNQNIMKREEIIALLTKRGVTVPEGITDADLNALLERSVSGAAAPVTNSGAANVDNTAAETAGRTAERQRVKEINDACRTAKMPAAFVTEHIEKGTDINAVRALIIEGLAATDDTESVVRSANAGVFFIGAEANEKKRSAIENSIMHRADPSIILLPEAREFRGMSLLEIGGECLSDAGIKTRGLSKREQATTMLGLDQSRGYHSSSDFPIILGNTINRTLRRAYDLQTRTFMPFCRRVNISDFKQITRTQLSELVGNFDAIPEGGEYKSASAGESKEVYQLAKYGKKIGFSWEMLINDDLSAFTRIPQMIANKSAQKQSDIVYGILTANADMSDGVALFHSTHGNLAGTASAITAAAMGLARAAMRKQKDPNGDFINVMPKYLVIGPDKETEAEMLIHALIVATKTTDTNVFRDSVTIIVEPRLTGNQWYLVADPNSIDTIEYAFLDGEQELFTEQRISFDVDGLEVKARMVFAAKAIDWRGMYKNAGA